MLSDAEDDDGWVVEFWDLGPNGGGEVLHVRRGASGEASLDALGESLSVTFVEWAIGIARMELQNY
ncbi:hypothetical protein ABT112_16535 [Streptomyces sp. NPDC002055]|uniref:hypothetical protein n=1 Tax=Streptomyces sp. NPDC002055 TaxID=3154534 RepID=UPI0033249445